MIGEYSLCKTLCVSHQPHKKINQLLVGHGPNFLCVCLRIELGGNAVSVCRFLEALDMAAKALEDDHDERKENENVRR